jgi:hypothetical protein
MAQHFMTTKKIFEGIQVSVLTTPILYGRMIGMQDKTLPDSNKKIVMALLTSNNQ